MNSFEAIVSSRVMTGVFITISASLAPGYISSTAPHNHKTLFLSIFNVIRNIGMNITVLCNHSTNHSHC